MVLRSLLLYFLVFSGCGAIFAQSSGTDSSKVAARLKELLSICKNVDFGDPKTTELGTFYKAAPYIVYRGKDTRYSWKRVANYNNEDEKKGVDEICLRINRTINRDPGFSITGYSTEKESEGTWHVLKIRYKNKSVEKTIIFAFLKIEGNFSLGDIDE